MLTMREPVNVFCGGDYATIVRSLGGLFIGHGVLTVELVGDSMFILGGEVVRVTPIDGDTRRVAFTARDSVKIVRESITDWSQHDKK